MAADYRLTEHAGPDELARRLRDAHRRVRALAVPGAEKMRMARRLLTICDVAKRDLDHASARLAPFLEDLALLESRTSSGQNIASGD